MHTSVKTFCYIHHLCLLLSADRCEACAAMQSYNSRSALLQSSSNPCSSSLCRHNQRNRFVVSSSLRPIHQQAATECLSVQQQHIEQESCTPLSPPPAHNNQQQQQQQHQHHPQHQLHQQQQQRFLWRVKIGQLGGSVLLFLAASLAGAGRQQAAVAAALPPPWETTVDTSSRSSSSSSSSSSSRVHKGSSSRVFTDFSEDFAGASILATTPSSSSSSSSRYGQLQGSSWGGSSPQPLLSTAAAPSSSSSSTAASLSPQQQQQQQQQQQPAVSLDDLLAFEQAAVTLFQGTKQSVVNITHMRAMPHFYTLDIHRMAVGQGSGFIWDKNGHVVTNYHVSGTLGGGGECLEGGGGG